MSAYEIFKALDTNGDGVLNRAEIKEACKKIKGNLSDWEIDQLITKFDITGDGRFDYPEFLKLLEGASLPQQPQPRVSFTSRWEEFKGFDLDRDVKLNRLEIKEACNKIKGYTSDAELDQLIRKYDITGDGKFDYAEYLNLVEGQTLLPQQPSPRIQAGMSPYEAFKAIDKNGDGQLNKAEITEAFKKIKSSVSDAEIDQLIKKFDITGDGKFDYGEFLKMVGQL